MTTEALTPAQMRIAIAADAAEMIRADKFTMKSGTGYLRAYVADLESRMDDDLQMHLDAVTATCTVCQLGAALLAKAHLYDNVPMRALDGYGGRLHIGQRSELVRMLSGIFPARTLDMMEAAFEQRVLVGDTDDVYGAAVYGLDFEDDQDRALAVFANIGANGGDFVVDPVSYDEYEERMEDHANREPDDDLDEDDDFDIDDDEADD